MLRNLVGSASRFLNDLNNSLRTEEEKSSEKSIPISTSPTQPNSYQQLQRVLLTDEVNRTLVNEYAAHRQGERGDEEIGWLLLGVREESEALVLATLPAGAGRDAGVAHVSFNSTAQALAARILRQWDKRLVTLGVLHTHPGNLRHPSSGDYRGDIRWVPQLTGKEGVFGIGTADAMENGRTSPLVAYKPDVYRQCVGSLCFSWYALGDGDEKYRALPVDLTLGPELAQPLRSVWPVLETYADQLERLCLQQKKLHFEVGMEAGQPFLGINLSLAEEKNRLRLLLKAGEVRYYLLKADDVIEVDPKELRVDRGVYLILAELAGLG